MPLISPKVTRRGRRFGDTVREANNRYALSLLNFDAPAKKNMTIRHFYRKHFRVWLYTLENNARNNFKKLLFHFHLIRNSNDTLTRTQNVCNLNFICIFMGVRAAHDRMLL